jgi:hypothetical protein
MSPEQEKALLEMLDRQQILDAIHRYCRGIDRFDRDLLLSAYHPDGIDDHGIFVGGRESFADWAMAYHREFQISHHHMVFNHSVDLDGNVAHAETYWLFFGENRAKPNTFAIGRYLDRMEKRDGLWAIVNRVCITECVNEVSETELPEAYRSMLISNGGNLRSREDRSYDRPLIARKEA